jgi:hypothetical protein
MLADIAHALGQNPQNDLRLPVHEAGEDFVEGTLQFETVPLRVYFEHSLSYLALMSNDEFALRRVADRIQPSVTVA